MVSTKVMPVSVTIVIVVNQQAILLFKLCSATLDIMSIFFLLVKRFEFIFYIKGQMHHQKDLGST